MIATHHHHGYAQSSWFACTIYFIFYVCLFADQADEVLLSGSSFTVRFPASSGTLYYDPIFELTLTPSKGGAFRQNAWLLYVVIALGVLVSPRKKWQ